MGRMGIGRGACTEPPGPRSHSARSWQANELLMASGPAHLPRGVVSHSAGSWRTATWQVCSSARPELAVCGPLVQTPVFRRSPVMLGTAAPPHCARYLARRAPVPRRMQLWGGRRERGFGGKGRRGGAVFGRSGTRMDGSGWALRVAEASGVSREDAGWEMGARGGWMAYAMRRAFRGESRPLILAHPRRFGRGAACVCTPPCQSLAAGPN